MSASVLYLTTGLPGAGKTTLARELAEAHGILRLTPDEWMAPLFGDHDAGGRRDILEGRMIWAAHEVLSNASVILDFGCWSPQERYAIRAITESAGARFDLRFVHVDETVRRSRAAARWQETPDTTFPITAADHDRYQAMFTPPSDAELGYSPIPPPPAGFANWFHWASRRWPSLPRFDRD